MALLHVVIQGPGLMEVRPSSVCARSPTGSLPFNQQEGEKGVEEPIWRVCMGRAWKQHVPLSFIFHWLNFG